MATITTGSFAKSLQPGVQAWYGWEYNKHEPEWPALFETDTSKKAFEEDVSVSTFGLAPTKTQGGSISYDDMAQGFVTRYTQVVYGLGFIITREAKEDAQGDGDLGKLGKRGARALAFSIRTTKEVNGANIYNRAFNNAYVGGDGLEMCSTVHLHKAGGTWQNELTTASDLNEAALEQACIDIAAWTNDRGLQIHVKPTELVYHSNNQFVACRILDGPNQVDTAERNVNALGRKGIIPKHSMNHYFTSAQAWFIRTSCPDGAKMIQRRPAELTTDNDFDTENAKFKSTERYVFGFTDNRTVFGSPGTGN